MNARVPLEIGGATAGTAYDTVARASNEVAGRLAQRLAGPPRLGVSSRR